MQTFGYIKRPNASNASSSSALFSLHTITSGLQALQQFAGMPVTGVLDDETKKVSSGFGYQIV